MMASARMTCDFLGLKPGDTALLCLPTEYIAGKMMVVRSIERQLRLISVKPSMTPLESLTTAPVFAAMVPSQVFSSLDNPLLRQIRHLIIGGGHIADALEDKLKDFPNAVWSTYGMTETLSHIALRRISGSERSPWYTPFEGVTISTNDEGCLIIDAPHVCPERLTTNDIAVIHPDDIGRTARCRFRIIGRKDNVICSGGIKLHIEEIERQLQKVISTPFAITKRPDDKYGEVVVIITTAPIAPTLFDTLEPYSRPKDIIVVDAIPMTATGKIDRRKAQEMAMDDER